MKSGTTLLRPVLLAAAVAALAPSQEDGITWLTSYSAAIQEARRTGKPIFLEFRCEP
jgi:hypothetical protein